MEIPGWVFVLVGSIVAAISFIIYANTGGFQLFILIGGMFFIYGLGKTAVLKMREKNERKLNGELAKFSKPTTFKDLPIGKEYYSRQLGSAYNHTRHNPGHHAPQAHHYARQTERGAHQAGHLNQGHSTMNRSVHNARHPSHPQYSYCPRCGARNAHANFCGNCGGRLR